MKKAEEEMPEGVAIALAAAGFGHIDSAEGLCCERMRKQVGNGFSSPCSFCPFCGAKQTPLEEVFAAEVFARALASSGNRGRAGCAAQEARAQAGGDYGPEGLAVFERWKAKRLAAGSEGPASCPLRSCAVAHVHLPTGELHGAEGPSPLQVAAELLRIGEDFDPEAVSPTNERVVLLLRRCGVGPDRLLAWLTANLGPHFTEEQVARANADADLFAVQLAALDAP